MSKSSSSSGIGFFGLLGVLFIALKLTEIGVVATWSWWLVLLPLYIVPLVFLVVFFVGLTVHLMKGK